MAARWTDGGGALLVTDDREAPRVTDDVIDEIIKMVSARGGPVEMVEHLPGYHPGQRIAAQLSVGADQFGTVGTCGGAAAAA